MYGNSIKDRADIQSTIFSDDEREDCVASMLTEMVGEKNERTGHTDVINKKQKMLNLTGR